MGLVQAHPTVLHVKAKSRVRRAAKQQNMVHSGVWRREAKRSIYKCRANVGSNLSNPRSDPMEE